MTDMEMTQTILGQFLLFLTTIAGFAIQLYREKRNRDWDVRDRELARALIAKKVEVAHDAVLQKIEENTEISREAFTEANNVNAKLLSMSNQINDRFDLRAEDIRRSSIDLKEEMHSTATNVEETKALVGETYAKVETIERKLP